MNSYCPLRAAGLVRPDFDFERIVKFGGANRPVQYPAAPIWDAVDFKQHITCFYTGHGGITRHPADVGGSQAHTNGALNDTHPSAHIFDYIVEAIRVINYGKKQYQPEDPMAAIQFLPIMGDPKHSIVTLVFH